MRNIPHGPRRDVTSFRKIAVGSWRHPRDPSAYAGLDLAAAPAEEFIRGVTGAAPVTLTAYVVKILGHCLERQPELNTVLLRDAFYPRSEVSVFVSVLTRELGQMDLSGFVLRGVPALSLPEVAARCDEETRRIRRGDDPAAGRICRRMRSMPPLLLRPFFRLMEFIQYTLNLAPAGLRIPRDRFGSVVVTDVGALGLNSALVPLAAFSRCPFVVCIGRPHEAPAVEAGRVVARTQLTVTFTMDHRHIDGAHGAAMMKHFQDVFENPTRHAAVFEGAPAP